MRIEEVNPTANTSRTYIWVDDVDKLLVELSQSGAAGRFHPPTDTNYGLREGVYVNVDDNLIRFGLLL